MKLSIIIPIYNVEKFLRRCLDSVLYTNWESFKYEVIIVDDESPDNSLAIAQEFQKQHHQIIIISQKNKGLGGARNTGIEKASGEYLFFLDSDDFLVGDNLPILVEHAKKTNADILEFSAETVDEHYDFLNKIFPVQHISAVSGENYFAEYHPANSVCNKIYRRSFITENKIRFMERVFVEDAPFNVEAYLKAQAVGSFPLVPVAFVQNTSSITRAKRTGKQMSKFIEDSILVTKKIASFSSSSSISAEAITEINRKVATFASGIILMILKSQNSLTIKQKYLNNLRLAGLYPVKFKSNIMIRDLFLFFVNNPKIFKIFHMFNKFIKTK